MKVDAKKEKIVYGLVGLLLGSVVTGFVFGDNSGDREYRRRRDEPRIERTERVSSNDHSLMSMKDMNKELENLSGDEFDKAFIEMMIAHHQGAVDMANMIPSRAKHEEIKTLGQAIIAAQEKEIADMKQWQKDWGYSTTDTMMMHDMH